jgi:hypothetical protein
MVVMVVLVYKKIQKNMKKCLSVLVLFLFSLTVYSQACCEENKMLINSLTRRIMVLEHKMNLVSCQYTLHYRIATGLYYYPDRDNESLYLNDRFPLNDNQTPYAVCDGAKGILLTEDATVYVIFQWWDNKWVVYNVAYGGINTCPEN